MCSLGVPGIDIREASEPMTYSVTFRKLALPDMENRIENVPALSTDWKDVPFHDWTSEQCAAAVASIGTAFEPYSGLFLKHGVTGQTLVTVTEDDLIDIGVAVGAHRRDILKHLVHLELNQQKVRPSNGFRGTSLLMEQDFIVSLAMEYSIL